jgi:Tol biopolymer transport system component
LVYPSWHPSGKYVAFSVNETNQAFHMNHRNRIEVFDRSSDVVVYDVEKHEIVTAPSLFSKDRFETFPTFSPDGKTLFFCSAEAQPMPEEFEKVRYSLCRIAFDPDSRTFGHQVDTLYNATADSARSVSFPRVSPDGNYLLFTLSEYGNFSIWHRDADLYIADLKTNRIHPLSAANSNETESYHSWSSNSRWIAFSSRRIDGLYTRPYFVYVDTAGQASKPFLLPQQDSRFYDRFMKSYNIPEFITGPVKPQARRLASFARKDKGTDIRFAGK